MKIEKESLIRADVEDDAVEIFKNSDKNSYAFKYFISNVVVSDEGYKEIYYAKRHTAIEILKMLRVGKVCVLCTPVNNEHVGEVFEPTLTPAMAFNLETDKGNGKKTGDICIYSTPNHIPEEMMKKYSVAVVPFSKIVEVMNSFKGRQNIIINPQDNHLTLNKQFVNAKMERFMCIWSDSVEASPRVNTYGYLEY
jgi:hypothetical protein